MKVLVTGGRRYSDDEFVFMTLDQFHALSPIALLIHGAATGADYLADLWAKSRDVAAIPCPADWGWHGRAAGPIRNREMLKHKPDLVVAFPGGTGTADMVRKARAAGVPVEIVDRSSDAKPARRRGR